jgi:purine-nucleoside phosphorylase
VEIYDQIQEAVAFIQRKFPNPIEVGMILGSGLGPMADAVENPVSIPYSEIPHFATSTVRGHDGKLVLGTIAGKTVGVLKGRLHYYEGYHMLQVTFPTRILKALGASSLVVTNAAGGVNASLSVGDIMLINDHIHMMPNPLIGPNDERLGLRFPPMAFGYFPGYIKLAHEVAKKLGIKIHEGVYVGLTGPSFETPAEIRYFGSVGGDAVGMSTTPEVIVANHGGMKVFGMSCITNILHKGPCVDSHQEVLDAANSTGPSMVRLLKEMLPSM